MTKPTAQREIEALLSLGEPTRRVLYEHVARQPAAVSRDEAARAIGIKRSLAAFHLDRLVEAGLLTAEYRRLSGRTGPGAGRPAKLYRRSRRRFAIGLPPRDHELLATLLAKSLSTNDPKRAVADAAREFGRSLGVRARRRLRGRATPGRLLRCAEDVLERIGFEPFRASGSEVRVRNCPFAPLSRRFTPVVCGVGVALARGIVDGAGDDSVHVTRDERPDQCCIVLTGQGAQVAERH